MSPLNRGPLMGPRMAPVGMRPPLPPPPRFGRPPMPGMPMRMPPPPPHPMGPMFGPMRPRMPPPRLRMLRPIGPPPPPPLPLFGPRSRGPPPLMMGPRGPPMRLGPRGMPLPQNLPHKRPRFPPGNGIITTKAMNNAKKAIKLEELELKKPWMTDEIRSEIQKKNKFYAKAKRNKYAKEWEEFKDLRNKVTRLIKEAKTEYFAKNPDEADLYRNEQDYCDERDENYESSDDDEIHHYCETCDREFDNDELLKDHLQTHTVCRIDGCPFSAPQKIVDKHINMQHRTGLYSKIKDLSTPEDIQKWINERKQKYPTKSNTNLNVSKDMEKQQRGEIIKHDKTSVLSWRLKKNTQSKTRKMKKSRQYPIDKPPLELNSDELYRGLRPFRGTSSLSVDDKFIDSDANLAISDDDTPPIVAEISDEENEKVPEGIDKTSKLCSLVADYGSDSDNDEPEEIPIKRIKLHDDELADNSISQVVIPANTDKVIEEMIVKKKELSKNSQLKSENKNRQCTDEGTKQFNKKNVKLPKRHMLLKRLLADDIRHERNLICQCIKYIADNNFFD